jgi:DNA invertase Pin-like site-specific DNA recombinase
MSTDKQSDTSPADQVARCRDFAKARGWAVAEDLVAMEAGVSGASRHNRPGLLGLIHRIDDWDVLLCFDFSRLTRNVEDHGWLLNRLRAEKRTAYEATTGLELSNLGAQVGGVMNAEYLDRLRAFTHNGLLRRAERGLAAGSPPYGYRTEEAPGGRRIIIHESQ